MPILNLSNVRLPTNVRSSCRLESLTNETFRILKTVYCYMVIEHTLDNPFLEYYIPVQESHATTEMHCLRLMLMSPNIVDFLGLHIVCMNSSKDVVRLRIEINYDNVFNMRRGLINITENISGITESMNPLEVPDLTELIRSPEESPVIIEPIETVKAIEVMEPPHLVSEVDKVTVYIDYPVRLWNSLLQDPCILYLIMEHQLTVGMIKSMFLTRFMSQKQSLHRSSDLWKIVKSAVMFKEILDRDLFNGRDNNQQPWLVYESDIAANNIEVDKGSGRPYVCKLLIDRRRY